MTDSGIDTACAREDLHRLLTRYEFGAITAEEKVAFERHVLECDACFEDLERGAAAVRALRGDPALFLRWQIVLTF